MKKKNKTAATMFSVAVIFCALVGSIKADSAPADMVYVPAGEFTMGNDGKNLAVSDEVLPDNEMPSRQVNLKAFYFDKYEVTNLEYKAYIDSLEKKGIKAFSHYNEAGIPIPDRWARESYPVGEDNHPVVDVDWYMANKYCESKDKRLPTEAEWEKAARGTDARVYPWGNEYKPEYSNNRSYWEITLGKKGDFGVPMPIGSFKTDVSPYGAFDVAGNAMEWTSTPYRPYPGGIMQEPQHEGEIYVLRGGAHNTIISEFGRTTTRHYRGPTDDRSPHADWHTDMNIGFRCAKDAE